VAGGGLSESLSYSNWAARGQTPIKDRKTAE